MPGQAGAHVAPPTSVGTAQGRGRSAAPISSLQDGGGDALGNRQAVGFSRASRILSFFIFKSAERPAGPGPAHVTSGGGEGFPPESPRSAAWRRRGARAPWSSRVSVRARGRR